jgi:preprotein translocase subunit YajC
MTMIHSSYTLLPLADAASASGGPMSLLVPLLMFGGMFFLMMAPQRKRQKAHTKMLQELKTGDKVLIAGGIYASISSVKDDRFVVAINEDTKIDILKSAVQSKVEADATAKKLVASK